MKLGNSIKALKVAVESRYYNNREAFNHFILSKWREFHANDKIRNKHEAMRWALWYSIPEDERILILAESLPDEELIGGHFASVTDEHISTLLRKTLGISVCFMIARALKA